MVSLNMSRTSSEVDVSSRGTIGYILGTEEDPLRKVLTMPPSLVVDGAWSPLTKKLVATGIVVAGVAAVAALVSRRRG